jgi:hypothetical protein
LKQCVEIERCHVLKLGKIVGHLPATWLVSCLDTEMGRMERFTQDVLCNVLTLPDRQT